MTGLDAVREKLEEIRAEIDMPEIAAVTIDLLISEALTLMESEQGEQKALLCLREFRGMIRDEGEDFRLRANGLANQIRIGTLFERIDAILGTPTVSGEDK